jgi:CheY-like chemotaxis protein
MILFILSINLILDFYFNFKLAMLFDFIFIILSSIPYLLNLRGYKNISSFVLLVIINIILGILYLILNKNYGSNIFIHIGYITPFVVLHRDEYKRIIFFVLLSVSIFLISTQMPSLLVINYDNDQILLESIISVVVMCSACLYILKNINKEYQTKYYYFEKEKNTIINSSKSGIILIDELFNVVEYNSIAFLGIKKFLNKKLVKGSNISDYISLSIVQKFLNQMNQSSKNTVEFEYKNSFFKISVSSNSGMIQFPLLVMVEDFTNEKNRLNLIEEEKNKSLEANLHKNNLLKNISHEIKTPINAMLGISEVLSKKFKNEIESDFIEKIHSISENLLELVDDIIYINEQFKSEIVVFSFKESLLESLYLVKKNYSAKDLEINISSNVINEYNLEGNLKAIIKLIKKLIEFLFEVKVANSIHLSVSISEVSEKQILLRIKIEFNSLSDFKLVLADIFNESILTNKTVYMTERNNIRIKIINNLLQFLDSSLFIEKDANSTKIEVPLKITRTDKKEEKLNLQSLDFSTKKVLIVDDHEINQIILEEYLSKWKIKTEVAENGFTALKKIQEQEFDLILLDLQMPEMNGYEFTEILRSMNDSKISSIPIIAVSASTISDVIEETKSVGMNDILSKPFEINDLELKLKKFLIDIV